MGLGRGREEDEEEEEEKASFRDVSNLVNMTPDIILLCIITLKDRDERK